jgi:hypothetical protein
MSPASGAMRSRRQERFLTGAAIVGVCVVLGHLALGPDAIPIPVMAVAVVALVASLWRLSILRRRSP